MHVEHLRRLARVGVVALGTVVLSCLVIGSPTAAGQDVAPAPKPSGPTSAPGANPATNPSAFDPSLPTPPDVTGVVFQNELTGSTVFSAGFCRTGWAWGETGDQGFKLTVAGRCADESETADIALPGRGIDIGDGDLALDFKTVSGSNRATVSLYVRNQAGMLVGASTNATVGEATLFSRVEGTTTTIASRTDIGELLVPGDWNRMAVRVRGGEIWLLLNDEAVLFAEGVPSQTGRIGIRVLREGDLEDEQEVAVIFRRLTLSTVADGDPAAAPTYTQP